MAITAVGVLNIRFPRAKTERIVPKLSWNPEISFGFVLAAGVRTTRLFLCSRKASLPTTKTADPSGPVLKEASLGTFSLPVAVSCLEVIR